MNVRYARVNGVFFCYKIAFSIISVSRQVEINKSINKIRNWHRWKGRHWASGVWSLESGVWSLESGVWRSR